MSEHRKKSASILLRTEGKTISLELYPSAEWPEQNGSEGLFRVRINDVWHCPAGKYSFLSMNAIGELLATLLNNGELPEEETAPYLPYAADVTVYLDCWPGPENGNIKVEPYQKRDGRWYVQAWVFGRGPVEACCNDVTLLRVRR